MSDLDKGGRGFEGLAGISTETPAQPVPIKQEPPPATHDGGKSGAGTEEPPRSSTSQARSPPDPLSQTKGPSSSFQIVGVLVVLVVAVAVWAMTAGNSGPASRTQGNSSAVNETYGSQAASAPEPDEQQPPMGTELVLTAPQIRYCVFEKLRLDGAGSSVNQYDASSVDLFNSLISDFNGRCGSFRYREGSLAPIEREGVARQANLMAEGRARMLAVADAASVAAPPTEVALADASQALAEAMDAANEAQAAADAAAPAGVGGFASLENLELGAEIGSDLNVTAPTTRFSATDTIYAAIGTTTSGGVVPGVLTVRWSYGADEQLVHEESRAIDFSGDGMTAFQISKPDGWPLGDYKVQVTLDNRSTKTRSFKVL